MTEWKPAKGWLEGKEVPKNGVGDPNFGTLEEVRKIFTDEQITYLVNKQLYALEYQRETHRKRAEIERETLAPVKKKVHELFGVSWIKATPEQVKEAMEELKKGSSEEKE